MCAIGWHSFTESTRYTLLTGGIDGDRIGDQSDHRRSDYIIVVRKCSKCGKRIAIKKNMEGYSSLNTRMDIDVVDELIDRYERQLTARALKEL